MKLNAITVIVFILVAVAAASFFLFQPQAALYAGLHSLNLIPQPEQFTELSFENPSTLPHALVAKQPLVFSFHIHNVEFATTTYPYEVYFRYPDSSQISLASGTVILSSDASITIPVSYSFHSPKPTGEVVVNLPAKNNQSIDFLLLAN